jgi:hypothetical protein
MVSDLKASGHPSNLSINALKEKDRMVHRVTEVYGLLGAVLLCVNVVLPEGSDPVFVLVMGGPVFTQFRYVFPSERKQGVWLC